MVGTLEQLTSRLKSWNKNVYDHLETRKQKLLKLLSWIQEELEKSNSVVLHKKKMNIREEMEEVLDHEEILWKQKLRCN